MNPSGLALVLRLFALAGPAAALPDPQALLDRAISAYRNLDDENAAEALRQVLAHPASSTVRASAHIYLGLIALNARQPDQAREEFRAALLADATIELPVGSSPKARLAFGEVWHDLFSEVSSSNSAHASPPSPAPVAATTDTTTATLPPSRSHLAAYLLGGGAVVATAMAIYGGLQVDAYTSQVSGLSGTAQQNRPNSDALQSAYNSAQVWRFGWPIAVGVGVACLGTAVLAW